jgi:hypothetical protein
MTASDQLNGGLTTNNRGVIFFHDRIFNQSMRTARLTKIDAYFTTALTFTLNIFTHLNHRCTGVADIQAFGRFINEIIIRHFFPFTFTSC